MFVILLAIPLNMYSAEKNVSLTPFPVIAYSSTTSLMLGAIIFLNFKDTERPDAQTDRLQFLGIYTIKNQVISNVGVTKYFNNDTILYKGGIGFIRFPTEFYGIGSRNSIDDKEHFSSDSFPVNQALLFRLSEKGEAKIWLGPSYYFKYVGYSDLEKDGVLITGEVEGTEGTRVSAPGIRFVYDARDNSIWTTRGNYFESEIQYNTKYAGSTQNSAALNANYRHFWDCADILPVSARKKFVLGVHAFWEAQKGNVPLTLMNEMGGGGMETILRGYGERFLDKCKYALESEFRYPLYKRFSGTLFGGFGDVSDEPFGFALERTHYAAGIGLRYAIVDDDDRMNFRFDIAYNREKTVETVFNIMEAF